MKYKYAKRQLQSIADGGFSAWMEKNNYWNTDEVDAVFARIYKEVLRMENELKQLRKRRPTLMTDDKNEQESPDKLAEWINDKECQIICSTSGNPDLEATFDRLRKIIISKFGQTPADFEARIREDVKRELMDEIKGVLS